MESTLERINKAAMKFLVPLDPQETYRIIVKEALSLINADYGSILLAESGTLTRVYASRKAAYKTVIRKDGYTYKCFQRNKPILINIKSVGKVHPEIQHTGIRWSLFIPLSYQTKSIGVLTINTKDEEKITNKEIAMLKLFGSLASLAILKTKHYQEALRALETRDLFISLASHELKTPLTAVSGYSQLLERKLKDSIDHKAKDTLVSLQKETKRLTYLLGELLEINQIKTGEFRFEWGDYSLKEIVRNAIDTVAISHPDRVVVFVDGIGDKSDIVICDPNKLHQVIVNLINNAIKFSDPSSTITIELSIDLQDIRIAVKDAGVGIGRKDLSRVFEGFYKGQNSRKEGMGLGLFLAKHVINSHRGKIELFSDIGAGTVVQIHLPLTS